MHFSATHSAVVNAIRISRGQTRSPTQTTTIVLAVGEFLRHYLAFLPQKSSILIFRVLRTSARRLHPVRWEDFDTCALLGAAAATTRAGDIGRVFLMDEVTSVARPRFDTPPRALSNTPPNADVHVHNTNARPS